LDSSVQPAVLFRHGHQVVNGLVSVSSHADHLLEGEVGSVESVVDGLVEEDVHGLGGKLSKNGEDDWCEVGWKERWPVVLWCVNPTE